MDEIKEYIKEIKKDFFRYRNGLIAQQLKNLYPDKTLIFGLIIPQFAEIAKKYPKNFNLASSLWKETGNRESRILSLYLFPLDRITKEESIKMITEVRSIEEAELLAFRVLRHLSFAHELIIETFGSTPMGPFPKHAIEMLRRNLTSFS